ncbi:hypothetical protein BSZ35_11145 [Salinibacter sp. 10B]|uniref:hypothetical protein n=1 Tax=Salinibacter sp. 10B TaxID=1923971 RepID=UPI000CF460CF|nr:hypothetical protein [Salinibacter sp. 10B]PQJ35077.1 hypothetical protein BSZ35_11145 [Salinibacter sp. 10B]
MSFLRRAKTILQHRVRQFVGQHPTLYNLVFQYRDGYQDRLVNDDTDICIEGFPRSANSFAVGAFKQAQEEPLTVAHHNHAPAPILDAVDRGVPTIVLVRDPVEAVVSFRALQLQNSVVSETRSSLLAISHLVQLRAWIAFYERIEPVREHVVVAPFEVVIDDFGTVIEALNRQFGTTFARFDHTEENVESIRDERGYHALPSEQRRRLKTRSRERFEDEIGQQHPLVRTGRALRDCLVEDTPVSKVIS